MAGRTCSSEGALAGSELAVAVAHGLAALGAGQRDLFEGDYADELVGDPRQQRYN